MNGRWDDDENEQDLDFTGDALSPTVVAPVPRAVLITNLSDQTEEEDLNEFLTEAGETTVEKIIMGPPKPDGSLTAVVTFADPDNVQAAMGLTGVEFIDRVIKITVHQPQPSPSRPAQNPPPNRNQRPRGFANNQPNYGARPRGGGPPRGGRGAPRGGPRGGSNSLRPRSLRPPPISNGPQPDQPAPPSGDGFRQPAGDGFGRQRRRGGGLGMRPMANQSVNRPAARPVPPSNRDAPTRSYGAPAGPATNSNYRSPPLQSKYDSRGANSKMVAVKKMAVREMDADGFEHATTIRRMKKERRSKERRENKRRPRGGFMDRNREMDERYGFDDGRGRFEENSPIGGGGDGNIHSRGGNMGGGNMGASNMGNMNVRDMGNFGGNMDNGGMSSGFDRYNRGNSGAGSRGRRNLNPGRTAKKQHAETKKKTNLVNRFDALLNFDEDD